MAGSGKPVAAALAAAALLALCACGTPNPIVARDPIPPPPPGHRVVCHTTPFLFNAQLSSCLPVREPVVVVEKRPVVRALY